MKAPNGGPSNLSPKQWVRVRTAAFKRWFGDWELANLLNRAITAWKDENSKGKVIVNLSERARGRFKELLGIDVRQFVITDDAIRHIKKNHGENEELREQINITPEDIAVIPYLINNYDTMELNPGKDDKMGNRAIEIRKSINGVSIVGTIEKGKGKEFLVKNFRLKKSDALDASNKTPGPNVQNDSGIANVRKEIERIKQSAKNASKVVDENGEPRVIDGLFLNFQQATFFTKRLAKAEEVLQEVYKAKMETGEKYGTRAFYEKLYEFYSDKFPKLA